MLRSRTVCAALLLAVATQWCNADIGQAPVTLKKGNQVAELEMSHDAGHDMYEKWMSQALSSLMSAVASKNIEKLSDLHQVELEECSKKANSVTKHAKCIKRMFKHRDARPRSTKLQRLAPKNEPKPSEGEWVGGMRIRRAAPHVHKTDSYSLRKGDEDITPLGAVARVLNQAVLAQKNKSDEQSWQLAIEKVRSSAKKRKDARKAFAEREAKNELDTFQQLAFRGLSQKHNDAAELEDMIDKPDEMKKLIQEKKWKMTQDPVGRLTNLVRDGVKIGFQLAGENVTDFDEKSMSLISPRFFSVTPEQDSNSTVNVLSPSLFSIHNQGTGIENLTSLPNLVKGFNSRDQQEWLNFIIEAAGVDDQAEKLDKETADIENIKNVEDYEKEVRGENGQPLYFTKENVTEMYGDYEKRKIDTFEQLSRTYSKEQLKDMNTTGYALLTKEQLHALYGPHSPYNHSESLDKFSKMNKTFIEHRIEKDIELLSEMEKFKMAKKDIVLSPVLFTWLVLVTPALNTWVVLSPLVFSPIVLSPAVLGPIILSPWVFVPLILSPRVLSPLILTPMIFSPIVLSPLVLHPLVLSPGIFNPIILTPLVLSPLILSPQVFSPLVLSPLVLNPLILNPMVGAPLVLSPFVLSPLILSPQALFALVLSPYAGSPLVESKLIVASLVLSPSWLS